MKDVQSEKPSHNLPLEKVGIVNLEYPVTVKRKGGDRNLIMTIEMSVDLPSNQKGGHISRFIETVEQHLSIPQETESIEDLAEAIAGELLKIHDYAGKTLVCLKTKVDLAGKVCELAGTYDSVTAKKTVGVKVVGAIACPCAIAITGGLSHNQRADLTVEIATNGMDVEAEDLVSVCEKAFSAPVELRLKRPDEKRVVESMHKNPMFTEDVVRKCVHMLSKRYEGATCRVECVSHESIHPYDVFAEWKGTL